MITQFDLVGYCDADIAGSLTDRKSTSGTCQLLGMSLVSLFSKKQNSIALSTTETEYVAAGYCCAQILWMRQTLSDYGLTFPPTTIYCDSSSAIDLSKNHVHHSRTKHIDIRHRFIRDHQDKKDISLEHIATGKTNFLIYSQNHLKPSNFASFEGNWEYYHSPHRSIRHVHTHISH